MSDGFELVNTPQFLLGVLSSAKEWFPAEVSQWTGTQVCPECLIRASSLLTVPSDSGASGTELYPQAGMWTAHSRGHSPLFWEPVSGWRKLYSSGCVRVCEYVCTTNGHELCVGTQLALCTRLAVCVQPC